MCGRYIIDSGLDYEEIINIVGAVEETQKYKTGEIFPTDTVPIVTSEDCIKKLRWVKWGFQSFDKKPIINARAETVHSRPLFKDSFYSRRCLVPASAYFEWHQEDKRKVKYRIGLEDHHLFYMAGLYNIFYDKSNAPYTGSVIITTSSNTAIREIHDRMPVILEPGSEDFWLNGNSQDYGSIIKMLRPYKEKDMYFQPVA